MPDAQSLAAVEHVPGVAKPDPILTVEGVVRRRATPGVEVMVGAEAAAQIDGGPYVVAVTIARR